MVAGKTLEEKCAQLIEQLARYGKRSTPKIMQSFTIAKQRLHDNGNAIAIAQSLADNVFIWADALEKNNQRLSRQLNFRDEWNTVNQAIEVLEIFYEDESVKKPRNFAAFKQRIAKQQKELNSLEERDLASHARSGGWGRDND